MSTLSSLCRIEAGECGVLSRGRWSGIAIVAWTATLVAASIGACLAARRLPDWHGAVAGPELARTVAIPAAALLLYAVAMRIGERRRPDEPTPSRAPQELLTGVGVGFAYISLVLALLWACGLYRVAPGHRKHPLQHFVYNAYISAVL